MILVVGKMGDLLLLVSEEPTMVGAWREIVVRESERLTTGRLIAAPEPAKRSTGYTSKRGIFSPEAAVYRQGDVRGPDNAMLVEEQ